MSIAQHRMILVLAVNVSMVESCEARPPAPANLVIYNYSNFLGSRIGPNSLPVIDISIIICFNSVYGYIHQ